MSPTLLSEEVSNRETFQTSSICSSPPPHNSTSMHPFTPLLPSEISICYDVISSKFPMPEGKAFQFKTITTLEPPKAEMLAWNEGKGDGPKPQRLGYSIFYVRNTDKLYEAVVDIPNNSLQSLTPVKKGHHGFADGPQILEMEQIALADPTVQAEIAKLQLPEGSTVISDPWIYGSDGVADQRLQFQCFLYLQSPHPGSNVDSNHYAMPLSISPVIDVETKKIIRIDHLPTGADFTPSTPKSYKVPPPAEYTPEHQELRKDLKPLHVVQPEGASFTITEEGTQGSGGAVVEWQKWRMRTSFNYREGMVLHNVEYDGRSLFYRVSLSEMNIPYGDPRPPYHKKAAFDLGDAGAGVMANNLKLGCDCLGSIHYLSSNLADDYGKPLEMPNVVCIHEQDAGIGFKHTNYRTGRAVVTRSRELVLQSIITVSNYEYILAFIFTQSGELSYEVRATGILSTAPIEDGLSVPWGTVVHPGVLAQHHQHVFSLRIDPALDGPGPNRVVYEEAHAMPLDPITNPFGVGYTTTETPITISSGMNTATESNRIFKIQNPTSRNPTNSKPVAYKIAVPPFQKMLAHPTSFHHKRAEFADKAIYVTRYHDRELFSAGTWTNQSRGGEGVRSWADREEDVTENPVVWVQFGINHIPRCEDFPVMPCETIKVSLKPVNFFTRNPGIDVPPSTQEVNKSVLLGNQSASGAGVGGPQATARVNGNGGLNVDVAASGAANGNGNGNGNGCCGNGSNGNSNGNGNGNGVGAGVNGH
ncbi:copper amine oxidase [Geopyxis carbonaria]|nr:copper amine oxidase [Geopyxis carbonaria]